MKEIQKIPLDRIDSLDETFSVNFMPDFKTLRSSIEEIGLIQPVLLREKKDGYQIVCGFRRISIFRELGNPEIESSVLRENEKDDFNLFSLALHENMTTRGLNTVEKAIALDKLVYLFQIDPARVVKTFLPLLFLETNEKILNTYFALARMEPEVKRYVLKEEVSRSNIRMLSAFTSEDRRAILSLISPLKLGENRLREVLTLLEEISRRDLVRVNEIIHRPEIEASLSQKDLTPSQRTERVKRGLMDLRYPIMRHREERFEEKRRDLNLPFGVSIHHSPFFERRGLRIEFQFETLDQYRSILSSLSLLVDKEEFKELIQGL
jgi:ParB family chromosome partitioning protein